MIINEIISLNDVKYYIRFGDIPKGQRSTIWNAPNIYYQKQIGKKLPGVSVFAANFDPTKRLWKFNTYELGESGIAGLDELLSQAINKTIPVYLVTGAVHSEQGIDGEPLLRGVKIVKQLDPRQLYWEGYFDPEMDLDNDSLSEQWTPRFIIMRRSRNGYMVFVTDEKWSSREIDAYVFEDYDVAMQKRDELSSQYPRAADLRVQTI